MHEPSTTIDDITPYETNNKHSIFVKKELGLGKNFVTDAAEDVLVMVYYDPFVFLTEIGITTTVIGSLAIIIGLYSVFQSDYEVLSRIGAFLGAQIGAMMLYFVWKEYSKTLCISHRYGVHRIGETLKFIEDGRVLEILDAALIENFWVKHSVVDGHPRSYVMARTEGSDTQLFNITRYCGNPITTEEEVLAAMDQFVARPMLGVGGRLLGN